jgi:hypothetical protein
MHNGHLADPLNDFAKRMKAISAKRKKTEADFKALADLEWEGGLYLNHEQRPIIPGRVLESVIVEGARKSKEGKLALSGLFVDNDAVIEYDGRHDARTLEELKQDPRFRLTVGVKVGQSRVMRTRPIFNNVKATFRVSLATVVANQSSLELWLRDAMTLVGIGDWRPRHGRGEVLSIEKVALEAAA